MPRRKHPHPSHIWNAPASEERRTARLNPLRPRTPAPKSPAPVPRRTVKRNHLPPSLWRFSRPRHEPADRRCPTARRAEKSTLAVHGCRSGIFAFNQNEVFDGSATDTYKALMAEKGFAFVPKQCQQGQPCALHVGLPAGVRVLWFRHRPLALRRRQQVDALRRQCRLQLGLHRCQLPHAGRPADQGRVEDGPGAGAEAGAASVTRAMTVNRPLNCESACNRDPVFGV